MPNIVTYENKIGAPKADSAGEEAFEIEGRHIESAYQEAGSYIGHGLGEIGQQVERHEEIQDTAANSKEGSAAFIALSNQLNQTAQAAAADPSNAADHFSKFQQSMEDTIGSIGNDAVTDAGKQNAERAQNTLRDEFARQGIAAQSSIEGQAVAQSMTETKNNLTQAVRNDPTLLDSAVSFLHGSMVDQLNAHNLTPENSARVTGEFTAPATKELARAAFSTMAERNPAAARDALSTGVFAKAFDANDIQWATSYANQQEKAAAIAQKAQTQQQKEADTAQFKQTTSQIFGSFIQPDGTLRVPPGAPQAVIKASLMPGADPGEIHSLADMTKTVLKDQEAGTKVVTDPATYDSFSKKMLDNNLTTQEIYQARADGQLSDKDMAYFYSGSKRLAEDPAKKIAEKQFDAWATAQKPAFTHSTNLLTGSDPIGAQRYNQFYQAAHARFDQLYESKGDWQSSIRQGSNDYLGSMAQQYQHGKGNGLPPPVHVGTVQDAMKLKPGTQFIGSDGVLRTR